jgi:hypothetical protein
MRSVATLAAILVASLSTACGGGCPECGYPTAYRPRDWQGGYEETPIGRGRYIVTFHGNDYTSASDVKTMAMRRAYELCTRDGFSDVNIESQDGGSKSSTETDVRVGGYGSFAHARSTSSTSEKFNVALTTRCTAAAVAAPSGPAPTAAPAPKAGGEIERTIP